MRYLAHSWATLLYLKNPTTNGARRIKSALATLQSELLIHRSVRPGKSTVVTILDERGQGRAYQHPAREKNQRYVQIPANFWTNRWVHSLSGAAIAILLAIVVELWSRRRVSCWVSPAEARSRYALSADTWTRGVRELRSKNLILVERLPVSQNVFEEPGRYRNAYRLAADALNRAEYHAQFDDVRDSLEKTLALV
jgi:hypothetical protein